MNRLLIFDQIFLILQRSIQNAPLPLCPCAKYLINLSHTTAITSLHGNLIKRDLGRGKGIVRGGEGKETLTLTPFLPPCTGAMDSQSKSNHSVESLVRTEFSWDHHDIKRKGSGLNLIKEKS